MASVWQFLNYNCSWNRQVHGDEFFEKHVSSCCIVFQVSEHKNILSRCFLLFDFFTLVPLFSATDVEVTWGGFANPFMAAWTNPQAVIKEVKTFPSCSSAALPPPHGVRGQKSHRVETRSVVIFPLSQCLIVGTSASVTQRGRDKTSTMSASVVQHHS